jgi:hypothetical protein
VGEFQSKQVSVGPVPIVGLSGGRHVSSTVTGAVLGLGLSGCYYYAGPYDVYSSPYYYPGYSPYSYYYGPRYYYGAPRFYGGYRYYNGGGHAPRYYGGGYRHGHH